MLYWRRPLIEMGKKADALQQKSPAEFFADNRNIAGFDNVCYGCLI